MFRCPGPFWVLAALPPILFGGAVLARPDDGPIPDSTLHASTISDSTSLDSTSLDSTSPAPPSSSWTLDEALARAHRESPVHRAAAARRQLADADLVQARTLPFDPEISIEAAERRGPERTGVDRGVEIGQEIEIGGQRRKRILVAEMAVAEAGSRFRRAADELTHRVELAFALGLAEERRVEIARAELALVENLLRFEEKRLEAGAGTQLDLNLARAATGHARRSLQEALVARAGARTALAEAVGVDPARAPVPVGPGPAPLGETAPLDALVERALDRRPDLAAERTALAAAERQVELQRSLALPHLRAGLFARREEGDEITGGAIGFVVPLFDRNQGGIARSAADRTIAAATLATAELAVRRSVADANARHGAAEAAVRALDTLVVGTLRESLALLERALEAGKVKAGEVLVLRRELVEARRHHVQAELDLATARADLRLAVGQASPPPPPPMPPTAGDGR